MMMMMINGRHGVLNAFMGCCDLKQVLPAVAGCGRQWVRLHKGSNPSVRQVITRGLQRPHSWCTYTALLGSCPLLEV